MCKMLIKIQVQTLKESEEGEHKRYKESVNTILKSFTVMPFTNVVLMGPGTGITSKL